jgi:hypothetical protein
VVWIDHLHLRYREGARSLFVFREPALDRHMLIDYESMERWEPPFENDELSDDDRERVIRNMRRAFAPRRYTAKVMNVPTSGSSSARDIHQR